MNIVVNNPYRRLIEGESLEEIHSAMRDAVHEDLSRAFAANIRLIGGMVYFKPNTGTHVLLFKPTAKMEA